MENYRVSQWTFDTSAGAEIGLGALLLSGGLISLKDPHNNAHHFHYGGFGVGFSRGFELTRIQIPETITKNYVQSGNGSITNFPGTGVVFMTKAFSGKELTKGDICGLAAYVEFGAGLVAGYGATLMFLGINQMLALAGVPAPQLHLLEIAIAQAPAILFMRGSNMGPQASWALNGMLGMLT